jgi:hypothetical protein
MTRKELVDVLDLLVAFAIVSLCRAIDHMGSCCFPNTKIEEHWHGTIV